MSNHTISRREVIAASLAGGVAMSLPIELQAAARDAAESSEFQNGQKSGTGMRASAQLSAPHVAARSPFGRSF